MSKPFQVVGIGNAMVDVLAPCEDAFLAENGIEKGIMTLTDRARGIELYGLIMSARSKTTSWAKSLPMTCAPKARSMRRRWPPNPTRPKPGAASCWSPPMGSGR